MLRHGPGRDRRLWTIPERRYCKLDCNRARLALSLFSVFRGDSIRTHGFVDGGDEIGKSTGTAPASSLCNIFTLQFFGGVGGASSICRLLGGRQLAYDSDVMHTIKAVVRNGRLVVDEPTTLPEGSELELQLVDTGDDLDDEEREALHRSIALGLEQARRGEVHSADAVLRELRARR